MVNRLASGITDQIRRAIDIVDLVSAYVTLKKAGGQFKGLCPFHQEKTPSFHVSPDRQIFKCFGCGAGGDVFKFVQLRENVGFLEARQVLAAKAGIDLVSDPRTERNGSEVDQPSLEKVNRWAAGWFVEQFRAAGGKAAREYVLSRGLSAETVSKFGLGFAPEGWSNLLAAANAKSIPTPLLLAAGLIKRRDDGTGHYDAFRNRLIFPIHDAMNRVIGFGGRTLGDDPAKYLNSPQSVLFDKSRCLYGVGAARSRFQELRRAVVVEGYIDCLMAHQYGFSEAVATLGTALTIEHVRILRRYVDEVILLFDSDRAGQRASDNSLPLFFTSDLHVRIAQVPEGKDPADLLVSRGAEALSSALTSAMGALESKWNQVVRRCLNDAGGPDMRRAVEEFLGLVSQTAHYGTCDAIQRGLLANQIGKLLGLSSEEVHRHLGSMARRQTVPAAPEAAAEKSVAACASSSAMRDLLEVLLNEPGYFESVKSQFFPELLVSGIDQTIAEAAAALFEETGSFSGGALLARFEEVETAQRIVDLQIAGEAGGNYAARVEGAVATLQRVRQRERIDSLTAASRREEESVSVSLRAVGEMARGLHHFAARRHMTATPLKVGAGPGAPPGSS